MESPSLLSEKLMHCTAPREWDLLTRQNFSEQCTKKLKLQIQSCRIAAMQLLILSLCSKILQYEKQQTPVSSTAGLKLVLPTSFYTRQFYSPTALKHPNQTILLPKSNLHGVHWQKFPLEGASGSFSSPNSRTSAVFLTPIRKTGILTM